MAASSPRTGKRKKGTAPRTVARKGKPRTYDQSETGNSISEPTIEYTAKVRPIGNSKGVILNNQLLDTAGLAIDQDIVIRAKKGLITIEQAEIPTVTTDRSAWEKQLKAAIKAGAKPEGDLWEGLENEFDKTEW